MNIQQLCAAYLCHDNIAISISNEKNVHRSQIFFIVASGFHYLAYFGAGRKLRRNQYTVGIIFQWLHPALRPGEHGR